MKTRRLILASLMVSPLLSYSAFAERYLVGFKTQQLHQELAMPKNTMEIQSVIRARGYALTAEKIQTHLPVFNSVVVKDISNADAEMLKRNGNVLYVEKEVIHPLPIPVGLMNKPLINTTPFRFFEQERPWGIDAVHSPITWNATSGGQGTRVLVLDTGIDRDHPAVRPNLVGGKDFIGDEHTGYSYRDSVGHGTHVAGTIAGVLDKSGFSGVAPAANLLAGRVCAEKGCSSIAIVEGINWGIQQKVDVISMSLGGIWSTFAEQKAYKAAYDSGIILVAASGNDGMDSVGFPAALPEFIAVGAVGPDLKKAEFSQWGPELTIVAPGVDVVSSVPLGTGRESTVSVMDNQGQFQIVKSEIMQGGKTILTPEQGELVYVGLGTEADFSQVDLKGKIALIKRGELTFAEKVANATKAHAKGVLIFNNEAGIVRGKLNDDGEEVEIPVFAIEQASGEAIVNRLAAGEKVQSKSFMVVTNHIAMNGTSMATPHVSGVVALMRAANKSITPEQVKAILTSTALKLDDNEDNRTGAGLIQADMAVRAAMLLPKTTAP